MITEQKRAENLEKNLNTKTEIYLKREDLHPLKSHKGRSIPLMIDKYIKNGITNFCISSSGNAALAAIIAIKEKGDNIKLNIFVGENIDSKKLDILKQAIGNSNNISIKQMERPKQKAFQLDKECKAKFLRQSTDNKALEGYYELANELNEIEDLKAIFIPTSSGTAAQGIFDQFQKLEQKPQIHIVQTPQCHPFILRDNVNKEKSLANAIVDKVGHRKRNVLNLINKSNGFGWIGYNEEIQLAMELIKKSEDIDISANSALSVVGLIKYLSKHNNIEGSIVCLITGK